MLIPCKEFPFFGKNLFVNFTHQAISALQVAGELLHELLEARASLRPRGLLMRFRHGKGHREVTAHEERQRFDQDVLVALQLVELACQLIEALCMTEDGKRAFIALCREWLTTSAPSSPSR